jgi:hypothetical protein
LLRPALVSQLRLTIGGQRGRVTRLAYSRRLRELRTMNKHRIRLQIRLLHGDIAEIGKPERRDHTGSLPPIDAIAVGHYAGIPPLDAELAIDKAISQALLRRNDRQLVITELAKRNIINGDTGRPFFLPDPRSPGRVIADCGMGVPTQFAEPDLEALVRDLVWSLGLMGKKHLATVLVGSGNGNLPANRAVACWLQGVRDALRTAAQTNRDVFCITFVELSPKKLLQIHQALDLHRDLLKAADAAYVPPSAHEVDQMQQGNQRPTRQRREPFPRQVIVDDLKHELRFGTISGDSMVSECRMPYQMANVIERQEQVISAKNRTEQVRLGTSLCKLLVPPSLHSVLMSSPPLVLICDAASAQIAWEMIAVGHGLNARGDLNMSESSFLGLTRGLTRQIRLRGDRRPSPAYEPRRVLRALIVADPAEDARLPSALTEGRSISALFEAFNEEHKAQGRHRRIELTLLLGPKAAGKPSVVTDLLQQTVYDIIHFAGHGRYNQSSVTDSGWLFSHGQLFTARDLDTITRVPSLVFSNACGSGKMPARSRSLRRRAPSFAEAFMLAGAASFVCTAWDVDDRAALKFAETFYRNLLGMGLDPQPMYLAMQAGREEAIKTGGGLSSWGAYQHYGDPGFRLFR